ncbi:DUF5712 family protein [Sphingobacterium sp. DR205]|uniref:DUF5712 family protein n=1 Tax=Sphingobacterium sp. DR205 TaxID=2713573 RepID=UPI0013E49ED9|nr:DUF5712 family protein [Sphingobacterium sp. DR205]QIH36761.1 molybdopterin-guanine dinucleotide biosynthesis protein MobB [Sphingobacterium sp. DR205]
MYINITDRKEAENKGGSGKLVHYLEKENRTENRNEPEQWFNGQRQDVEAYEVRRALDGNRSKLGNHEAKFFLINISPSQKELAHLKAQYGDIGMKEQLKLYTENVMDEYARNFKRDGINSNRDLLWFAKVEDFRYYSHKDQEVKQGLKKRGDKKEGMQYHIQVIVSRKDITGRYKLSPMNSSKGRNAEHSKKMGQFDRMAFKQSGETLFDKQFGFDRELKDTLAHANILKNGSLIQRAQMDLLLTSQKEIEWDGQFPTELANKESQGTYANSTDMLKVVTEGIGGLFETLLEPVPSGINIVSEQEPRKKKKRKGRNYRR